MLLHYHGFVSWYDVGVVKWFAATAQLWESRLYHLRIMVVRQIDSQVIKAVCCWSLKARHGHNNLHKSAQSKGVKYHLHHILHKRFNISNRECFSVIRKKPHPNHEYNRNTVSIKTFQRCHFCVSVKSCTHSISVFHVTPIIESVSYPSETPDITCYQRPGRQSMPS